MHQPVILHSDMNNFYASVECLDNPSLRGKPMAVTGDPDARHGIILAKNYEAKKYGISTGEPLWMAKQKCPDIVFTPPRYDRYIQFSQAASQIYGEYTDRVESFGLDECWMDVSESVRLGKVINVTADESVIVDNRIDMSLVNAIAFNPYTHRYYKVTERVGEAFKDDLKLKK